MLRNHETEKPFMGPRYLVRTAGLEMHPIDQADRREYLKDSGGIGYCNITKCCTEVCPEHIKITDNAIIPLKERVADAYYDPIQWFLRKVRGSSSGSGAGVELPMLDARAVPAGTSPDDAARAVDNLPPKPPSTPVASKPEAVRRHRSPLRRARRQRRRLAPARRRVARAARSDRRTIRGPGDRHALPGPRRRPARPTPRGDAGSSSERTERRAATRVRHRWAPRCSTSTGPTRGTTGPSRTPRSPTISASRPTTSRSTRGWCGPSTWRVSWARGRSTSCSIRSSSSSSSPGRWRVKDAKLIPLWTAARRTLSGFDRWSAAHVPRALNTVADALANEAIDRAQAGGPASVVRRPRS